MSEPQLFRTVARTDRLHFRDENSWRYPEIMKFLEFDASDMGKIAGVKKSSVRLDHKMPQQVREYLEQLGNICNLVAEYFDGDVVKTSLWFKAPNPMFGGISARDMIRLGRYKKLMQLILDAHEESEAPR